MLGKSATFSLSGKFLVNQETLSLLWQTHAAFNAKVRQSLDIIQKILSDDTADPYSLFCKEVVQCIINAPDGFKSHKDVMDALSRVKIAGYTRKPFVANTSSISVLGESLAKKAEDYIAKGKTAFDIKELKGPFSIAFYAQVWSTAFAVLTSEIQSKINHRKEKQQWKEDLQAFLQNTDNKRFLAAAKKIDDFKRTKAASGKRNRDNFWYEFFDFLACQDFAQWKNDNEVFQPLSNEDWEAVNQSKPSRKTNAFKRKLFALNPSIQELYEQYKEYEQKFLKGKRPDRKPSFHRGKSYSQPDGTGAGKGIQYYTFSAPCTGNPQDGYFDLKYNVNKQLVTATFQIEDPNAEVADKQNKHPKKQLQVKCDPRLGRFSPKYQDEIKKQNKYLYNDPVDGKEKDAEISGIKLVFRNVKLNDDKTLKSADAYAVIRVEIEATKLTDKAKQVWTEDSTGKKKKQLPDNMRFAAIDATFMNKGGYIAIARRENNKTIIEKQLVIHATRKPNFIGPHLQRIKSEDKGLRRRKRLSGSKYPSNLAKHHQQRKEEALHRLSHAIIKTCLQYQCEMLVIENLRNFKTSNNNTRTQNRAYSLFSAAKREQLLTSLAQRYGIKIVSTHAALTSITCHRCSSIGVRFHQGKSKNPKNQNTPHQIQLFKSATGRRFYCPNCNTEQDADLNAACNIAKTFVKEDNHLNYAYSLTSQQRHEIQDNIFSGIQERYRKNGSTVVKNGSLTCK